jgi:diacylglycerol kinase (ATP)
MKRIKIIVNPIAGSGRSLEMLNELRPALERNGFDAQIFTTKRAGDAKFAAGDVKGFDFIASIGGDGTLNEVVNGLPDEARYLPVEGGRGSCRAASSDAPPVKSDSPRPPLVVIPVGTSNVFAREMMAAKSASGICGALAAGRTRRFDVGLAGTRRFLSMAGAGFDAEVVRHFHSHRDRPINILEWLTHGLQVSATYEAPDIVVEIDGKQVAGNASFVQVANTRRYGGPFIFTPGARADDGLFHVMWFKGKGMIERHMLWAAAFARDPKAWLTDIGEASGKVVTLSSEHDVAVQVDGDPAGALPQIFTLMPGWLEVVG